jgi:HEAT repeat protein
MAPYHPERALQLVRAFSGHDRMTPHDAREELVAMGEGVSPLLLEAMHDPEPQVRWESAKTLAEIATPLAAGGLVEALRDNDGGVRWVAAEALIAVGRPALDPLLHALLQHSDHVWLREGAHHVLCELRTHDPSLKAAIEPVIAGLEGIAPSYAVIAPAEHAVVMLDAHRFG